MTQAAQATRLQELTQKMDSDITKAIEALREDLMQVDLQLQRAANACSDALRGYGFTLSELGVVQGAGARIDAACAVVHEMIKHREQLKQLVEQG